MFTGIIKHLGVIKGIEEGKGGNKLLTIDLGPLAREVGIGSSVAVNGCCLTVVGKRGRLARFEAIRETLRRTNLKGLKPGDLVNLELALRLQDRLEGHLVQGHVDGIGRIAKIEPLRGSRKVWVEAPKRLVRMMIEKGSVALDGVSLTVVDVEEGSFSVCLIPHTLSNTNLGRKRVGDEINIEVDVVGKWVARLLRSSLKAKPHGGREG